MMFLSSPDSMIYLASLGLSMQVDSLMDLFLRSEPDDLFDL